MNEMLQEFDELSKEVGQKLIQANESDAEFWLTKTNLRVDAVDLEEIESNVCLDHNFQPEIARRGAAEGANSIVSSMSSKRQGLGNTVPASSITPC